MGAFVGFAVSFGGSAISQAITNNGNIDWAVAAVDGVFGAISGALATTGIGIAAGALIDAGLTLTNEAIVVGMQNNWQYSPQDIANMVISTVIAGVSSAYIGRNKIGYRDSLEFSQAEAAVNKFKSKMTRNIYKKSTQNATQKAISAASKHVNNLIIKSFFSSYALISYSYSFVSAFLPSFF